VGTSQRQHGNDQGFNGGGAAQAAVSTRTKSINREQRAK
jgi:hypothetical protein